MASKHYLDGDDPDDFDEYPVQRDDQPQQVEPSSQAFTPPKKSALVNVAVGNDRLPTKIDLNPRWKSTFSPSEYGQSILDAYHYAVYQLAVRLVETGTKPDSTLPRLRDTVPLLLQTRTYDEFHETWNTVYGAATYTVHGRGYNQYDEPGITITATPSSLLSITIDRDWVATADSTTIALDIVECCDQIRAKKPRLVHDIFLERESDQELTTRLVRHEQQLMRIDA